MPLDKDSFLLVPAGLGLGGWLLLQVVRLFRGERAQNRADAAQGDVINKLREELTRLHEQLEQKEQTIQRLVKEKAEQMEKLAEIPLLSDRINDLEEQIRAMLALFDHLIEAGALQLKPEHQQALVKMLTKALHREAVSNENPT